MKNKNFDGYNSIFATRFRKLIETRKDTQSNISKTLKIARQTVSMYYNGETIPTADKLYQIAVYFNVSADYLLGLTGEPAADEVVRAMCEETGLHSAAIESLLEKKKESDFLKVFQGHNPLHECVPRQYKRNRNPSQRKPAFGHCFL